MPGSGRMAHRQLERILSFLPHFPSLRHLSSHCSAARGPRHNMERGCLFSLPAPPPLLPLHHLAGDVQALPPGLRNVDLGHPVLLPASTPHHCGEQQLAYPRTAWQQPAPPQEPIHGQEQGQDPAPYSQRHPQQLERLCGPLCLGGYTFHDPISRQSHFCHVASFS